MLAKFGTHGTYIPRLFMGGALASVFLAGIGYFGIDLWLASTQWLLVGAILALFGIYMRMEE